MPKPKLKTRQKIYLPFKRLIDIIGSLIGILFCIALLWWWIFIINIFVSHNHPLFTQERMGKNAKKFKLIKFRSLKLSVDPQLASNSLKSEEYTGFGKFLRKTSLDETPQLLNIFVGQMSFIGPRPLICTGVDQETNELRIKNGSIILKPGLSGYAQIKQRNHLNPEEKAQYDFEYLQKFGFFFDIKIFICSIFKAFN